jgi:membrane fusion protein, multidrug efflux system
MMRRATLLFGAAVVLATGGCGNSSAVSPTPGNPPSAASSASATPAPQPETMSPAKGNNTGDVLSVLSVEHQLDVATERDGVVVSVAKDQGSMVSKGDVLGQLDDRMLQTEMVKAHDDLAVAQNNVKYKEAELKAKNAALQRQQQLRAAGLSSQADLEAADFEAKAAEFDMHGWEAMTESSQADIHRIEIEIDQTRLRAPFSGAIVGRYIRQGQEVAKGDKCFRISQLAPLQVQFQVPESAAPRPRQGAAVALVLVSEPNRSLGARVVKISPVVDPASDSYNVTAELTGKGISDLRPGMAVKVIWPDTAQAAR